jgi:hypothetical protein
MNCNIIKNLAKSYIYELEEDLKKDWKAIE